MMTKLLCWNVNHRLGRTQYRPDAADAAMATGADVLMFTEFFSPGSALEAFTEACVNGGWRHVAISEAAGKTNRVLLASKLPFQVLQLPKTTVDEHLSGNALLVRLDGGMTVFCLRVPTYQGPDRSAAWNWVRGIARMLLGQPPALLIGDLNTGLGAKRAVAQFAQILESGWTRLQPVGVGSFFGKDGYTSEIDHALVAGAERATARYVRYAGAYELAGHERALSDHVAIEVQLDLDGRGGGHSARNR